MTTIPNPNPAAPDPVKELQVAHETLLQKFEDLLVRVADLEIWRETNKARE